MSTESLRIVWIYPDLLSTYGDRGNALILARRAQLRGMPVEVLEVRSDQRLPDQRPPAQSASDHRLPDHRPPDQRLPDQRPPDQREPIQSESCTASPAVNSQETVCHTLRQSAHGVTGVAFVHGTPFQYSTPLTVRHGFSGTGSLWLRLAPYVFVLASIVWMPRSTSVRAQSSVSLTDGAFFRSS